MSFARFNIHPILERNLAAMGYLAPTPVQDRTIEPALERRDVIGLAQTGTGKTAAFIVPLAHHLIASKPVKQIGRRRGEAIDTQARLRALVLCPTRELAQQVADEAGRIVQGSVLRVTCVYGKVAISPQRAAIDRGVDLLVGTPGRIRELLEEGALSLEHVRHVVIDEADRMLDMGFLPQVEGILKAIPAAARQTLLFTATMPRDVEDLARQFMRDPVRVEVGRHTTPVAHIQQHLVPVDDRDKVALILHLLETGNRRGVLIFCNTKRRVGWVGTALERNGMKLGMLHGDRSQAQRQKALDRFANDELRVLVATDVAARGLHIPAVRTVINYDLPLTPEEYVHRIGRAAHGLAIESPAGMAAGSGESFTLLNQRDRMRWRAICNTTGIEVYAEQVEGFEPLVPLLRRTRSPGASEAASGGTESTAPARQRRRGHGQRRSKKSRPIKKDQRPGHGVVRRNAG